MGLDGGQGVELSAVCQKPAPSLSVGTKPGGKKRKKDRGRMLQSVKDGARSDQEPENVLIPDVNIQNLHAGKNKQTKKQQEPSTKKYT